MPTSVYIRVCARAEDSVDLESVKAAMHKLVCVCVGVCACTPASECMLCGCVLKLCGCYGWECLRLGTVVAVCV